MCRLSGLRCLGEPDNAWTASTLLGKGCFWILKNTKGNCSITLCGDTPAPTAFFFLLPLPCGLCLGDCKTQELWPLSACSSVDTFDGGHSSVPSHVTDDLCSSRGQRAVTATHSGTPLQRVAAVDCILQETKD